MKQTTLGFVLLLAAALAVGACARSPESSVLYHCPMHPSYVSDKPGDCPICGMRLVPMDPPVATGATTEHVYYTCPMHPDVHEDAPGRCPECGMPLERRVERDAPGDAVAGAVPGLVSVTADQGRLAGIRTVVAAAGRVERGIRAVGAVEADETRMRQVTTKVAGFVERLYVAAIGQEVRAGQPLFELYSPELLASQEEYLRARETAARFEHSSLPEVRRGGADLAATARRRLELFDVPAEFLARLEATGVPERRVVFRAPFSGFVTAKDLLEGQRVEPGMPLLTVSDLSRVWVTAAIYEAETAAARVGRPARVTLPNDPSVALEGRLAFIYPTLQAETRTLKVRLEFPNPSLALRPGMFVNVELGVDGEAGVVVPDSAVLDSGTRTLVFVERTPGEFEPRAVRTGTRGNGQVVVRGGLDAGERVAVAANFLLDSESRLRSAVAAASAQGKGK